MLRAAVTRLAAAHGTKSKHHKSDMITTSSHRHPATQMTAGGGVQADLTGQAAAHGAGRTPTQNHSINVDDKPPDILNSLQRMQEEASGRPYPGKQQLMALAEASGLLNSSIWGKQAVASNKPGDKWYDGWSNIKVRGALLHSNVHLLPVCLTACMHACMLK